MAPSDTILLQSILDRMGTMDAKVDHIAEKQAVIAERVDAHIKSSAPETKSGLMSAMTVIKQWLFPIILAIFLLGRQSTEYTNKSVYRTPTTSKVTAMVDDTFLASDRRFDSIIMKQIYKSTGLKE